MKNLTTYETGATSHAVNSLILFTDNTAKLAELRDRIFKNYTTGNTYPDCYQFSVLLNAAKTHYYKELQHDPDACLEIANMTSEEENEFMELYSKDYESWKKENTLFHS